LQRHELPDARLKILLTNSTDIFAGGEDYVLILAKYLSRRGHSVTVSANPGHLLLTKCEEAGITSVPIRYAGMERVVAVAAQLRKELSARNIGIVHSNANYDRTCAAMAAAFTPVRHVASVHSAHSIQHNFTHWLRNRKGTGHFIADAESVKDVLVKEDRIPAEKITVVPIGVENDTEGFQAEARVRSRKRLGVNDTTIVIGNVARLVPFKGHKVLLHAIAEVVQTRGDVLFPIIGDGELQDELEQLSRTLNITPHVRFLGFQDHLSQWYPAFDIYCHSSLELAAEAFPLAILRALAGGLPVVSTNVGGIAMMVENGVSGFLTEPEKPQALAQTLLKVIADADLRRSMGRASFALFQKKFHASAMAEKVEEVYLKVLHS
jgi:glycosyltransferase involved in cell wall biosynthesis